MYTVVKGFIAEEDDQRMFNAEYEVESGVEGDES